MKVTDVLQVFDEGWIEIDVSLEDALPVIREIVADRVTSTEEIATTFDFFAGENLEPVVHFHKANEYISRFADLEVFAITANVITEDDYTDGVLSIDTIPCFEE